MSDDEQLILVDSGDREIGYLPKAAAHHGNGVLHRAFSLFVFNPQGELLVQRRAPGKRLSTKASSDPRKVAKRATKPSISATLILLVSIVFLLG